MLFLVKKPAPIKTPPLGSDQKLIEYAKNGNLEAIQSLFSTYHCSSIVNCKSKNDELGDEDWTPLHFSAWKGHESVVSYLLDNGADIHAKRSTGRTSLYLASAYGHESVVSLLLSKGANIHDKANGVTPLYIASEKGHESVVSLLLSKGANIHDKWKNQTSLHIARQNNHQEVVKILIRYGGTE
jgi:ankyrin repeat protein